MFVGIQGSGKTTTVAKIANYLKKQGYKIGVICADTYRPAAYEQLNQLLSPLGIPVFFNENSKNAIEIAKEGLEKFFSSGINIVLIDTAGRHKEQEFLLKEMKELEKEIKPNEVILTLDGTIGQQASIQAEAFHKATPIGSIIVTKLDTSAKGGGALSAVAATGAKIRFIGVGEKIDDIEAFYPNRFVSRLLGMGDIEGLVERVKLAEMQVSEEKVQALLSGHFTLEDMISQIKETRKLGPLRKIISKFPLPMLPNISDEQLEIAEKEMDKWSAIINSMTPEERKNPEILNSSRIKRIARGAGVLEGDVKKLIKQYNLMKKLMKSWKKRKGVPKLKI
jgi:signal recognition particle subunit SRP54